MLNVNNINNVWESQQCPLLKNLILLKKRYRLFPLCLLTMLCFLYNCIKRWKYFFELLMIYCLSCRTTISFPKLQKIYPWSLCWAFNWIEFSDFPILFLFFSACIAWINCIILSTVGVQNESFFSGCLIYWIIHYLFVGILPNLSYLVSFFLLWLICFLLKRTVVYAYAFQIW